MNYFYLILPLFLLTHNLAAQTGCTDPQANNFDPAALENDGSCLYPPTTYTLETITPLPANLEEVSGAIFINDQLWVHEDAGNEDRIYQIDSLTGNIEHLLTIANADNYDWEDIADDDTHVYIGDFGNNDGNRTNLRIYKFAKTDLAENVAIPEVIEFAFSDQTDFSVNTNNHNFDCEALLFFEDSLHLFSKNWVDFKTRHYVLPTTAGQHIAQLRDSLNVEAQITGADRSDSGEVVLLGYNVATSETIFWLLYDFPNNQFFKGNKRKISLGSALNNSQTEGVTFRNDRTGYVVSEKFSVLNQKILRFNLQPFFEIPLSNFTPDISDKIKIFPNPFQDRLTIEWSELNESIIDVQLTNSNGTVVINLPKSIHGFGKEFSISLANYPLPNGIYFVEIRTKNGVVRQKIIKN